MSTQTTLTEKSRLSLTLPAFYGMLVIMVSVVAAVVYASSEMAALRKSFDGLADQLGKNNEQLVNLDKRLAVMEDVRDRVESLERRVQTLRETLLQHCARTGDTQRAGQTGGPAGPDKVLGDY